MSGRKGKLVHALRTTEKGGEKGNRRKTKGRSNVSRRRNETGKRSCLRPEGGSKGVEGEIVYPNCKRPFSYVKGGLTEKTLWKGLPGRTEQGRKKEDNHLRPY